jgi:hypothetical protein
MTLLRETPRKRTGTRFCVCAVTTAWFTGD